MSRDAVSCLAKAKGLPEAFLRSLGLRDSGKGVISIPYFDEAGSRLFVRHRNPPGVEPRFVQPKGINLIPYGLNRLDVARKFSHLYVTEGETDTMTLWNCGLPALGLPGSATAKVLGAEHVEGIGAIHALPDNDKAGQQFFEGVRRRLAELGYVGTLRRVQVPTDYNDVSDWFAASGAKKFLREMEASVQVAEALPIAPRQATRSHERNGHVADSTKSKRAPIRVLEPYQPFPVDALPPVAKVYVRQAAAAMGCDPAFVALPVLAVLASAIGNTRVIRLRRSWTEPAILWTVVVGDSGTLKSPSFHCAVHHLFKVHERLLLDHKAEQAAHEDAVEEWRKAKKAHVKEGRPHPGASPENPAMRRVIVADATIESLAEILADNPRGTLVARDELAGWIGSFTKYKAKGSGSDVPNWLELHRAGTLLINRKTGERRSIFAKRASVSVAGGIQPGVLAKALTADLLDSGLAARLLLCWPPRVPKQWSEAEISPDTYRAFADLLDSLLALDFEIANDGEKVPRELPLSSDAKTLWVKFYNDWAKEQSAVEGALAAAYSKLEGYAARLALVYHVCGYACAKSDDAEPIETEAIQAGITLARWFAGEARRIYGAITETEGERDARRLIDFVRSRGGEITVRDLWKSNTCKYPDRETAEAALCSLALSGLGEWCDRPPGAQGGRPTRSFKLCTRNPETSLDGDD